MIDLMLSNDGDLYVSATGDVIITDSLCQDVKIRLKWIHDEWRLGPEFGFRWFEDVLVKNPSLENIQQLIRNEALQVEGVNDIEITSIDFDKEKRQIHFAFTLITSEETYKEEGTLYV